MFDRFSSPDSDDLIYFIQKVHHPVQLPYDLGVFGILGIQAAPQKTGYAGLCPLMALCCGPCALAPCNNRCSRQNRQRHLSAWWDSCCLVSSMLLLWNQQWFLLLSMKKNKNWKNGVCPILVWCTKNTRSQRQLIAAAHDRTVGGCQSVDADYFIRFLLSNPKLVRLPSHSSFLPVASKRASCTCEGWATCEEYHKLPGNCRSSICKWNL